MVIHWNTRLSAPGALAHRLQCRTACKTQNAVQYWVHYCKIQNGCQGAPKWPTGSGKGSNSGLLVRHNSKSEQPLKRPEIGAKSEQYQSFPPKRLDFIPKICFYPQKFLISYGSCLSLACFIDIFLYFSDFSRLTFLQDGFLYKRKTCN